MRREEFKMERPGLVKIGDVLAVKESKLPNSYFYTLEHSYAMSGNYSTIERITSDHGTVVDIEETARGFFVMMEFDEPDPHGKTSE